MQLLPSSLPELLRHVGVVFSFDKLALDTFAKLWASKIAPKVDQYNAKSNKPPLTRPPLMLLTNVRDDVPDFYGSVYNINYHDQNTLMTDTYLQVGGGALVMPGIWC